MARYLYSGVIDENGMRCIAMHPHYPQNSIYGRLIDATAT